jgi:hypothetical protein
MAGRFQCLQSVWAKFRTHCPGEVRVLNRNPQPAEQSLDSPEFDPVTNLWMRDDAVVLMLSNETKEKPVLLIYGIYTPGSQAAIECFINPERMSELRNPSPTTRPYCLTLASAHNHGRECGSPANRLLWRSGSSP